MKKKEKKHTPVAVGRYGGGGGIVSGSQTTLQMFISKVYIYEMKIYLGLIVCDGSLK
jgi:hypothetical protein